MRSPARAVIAAFLRGTSVAAGFGPLTFRHRSPDRHLGSEARRTALSWARTVIGRRRDPSTTSSTFCCGFSRRPCRPSSIACCCRCSDSTGAPTIAAAAAAADAPLSSVCHSRSDSPRCCPRSSAGTKSRTFPARPDPGGNWSRRRAYRRRRRRSVARLRVGSTSTCDRPTFVRASGTSGYARYDDSSCADATTVSRRGCRSSAAALHPDAPRAGGSRRPRGASGWTAGCC